MSLFGDIDLARRLEQNAALEMVAYAEAMARLGLSPEARVKPVADGYAVISGKHLPINRIGGLGMSGPVSAADLVQVETFYREAGLPAQVDLCPLADPSLMQILGERGYRVFRFYSVLARPLTEADAIPQAGEVAVELVAFGPLPAAASSNGRPLTGTGYGHRIARLIESKKKILL